MTQAQRIRYGSIDTIVIDGGPQPTIAVALCHGYGASGSDLAGLAVEWIHLLGDKASRFRFLFPEAPYTLEAMGMPDGHAWWPINMSQLAELVQADQFDRLHAEEPPGIADATEEICRTIGLAKAAMSGADTTLVLGGFSQGAMLTMNAALRGDLEPPAMLFQFSGTVVCQPQWQSQLSRLETTRVFQSHGTYDPVLPFSSANTLHQLLCGGGVDAKLHSFAGPHTIDHESIAITAQWLSSL